jgi:hypothetical protein
MKKTENNTNKTDKKTKKPVAPASSTSKAPVIANCSRTSNFVAHRCGESERRLTTHHPLLLFIPLVIVLVLSTTRNALLKLSEWIAGALNSGIAAILDMCNLDMDIKVGPVAVLVALVVIMILVIIGWWNSLRNKEAERCRKASETRYYFYDDIVEFCTKEKRESFRTISGIVSVRVSPSINTSFGPTFMTGLVALLSLNSKPLWQRKYGFRDVTIVTLGSPSETIVLHDVEDPATLVSNIKKHYPQCNVEYYGNSFEL